MTEQPKRIARRFREEVVTNENMALADVLLAPNFRYYGPPSLGPGPLDCEGLKHLLVAYKHAFPDLHETIGDQLVDGDRVVQMTTSRGTFTGEMMGMSPTGKGYEISGIDVVHVVDGQIVELRAMFDSLGLVRQTGMTIG
ncbi:MAG: ester cyclase [Chloroflexota bacterium]|nr:ester cyclase [Chloroflexota bacterium]